MDSLSPGDIFFSTDVTCALPPSIQQTGFLAHNNNKQEAKGCEDVKMNDDKASTRSYFHTSSKVSGRTTESVKAFVANRNKSWQSSDSNCLSCIQGRSCRTNHKSPEKKTKHTGVRCQSSGGHVTGEKGAQVVVPTSNNIKRSSCGAEREIGTKQHECVDGFGEGDQQHLFTNARSQHPQFQTRLQSTSPVILLYEADRAPENILHLIKWIMDCYTDCCKLILCCDDDVHMLESVRNRCKVVNVDAPATHEMMGFLVRISKKEGFDLPMSFAAKIATKVKDLRSAIWHLKLAKHTTILSLKINRSQYSGKRGKLQKLLVDFVSPQLIIQKLVEQFLKEMPSSSKRELYYWHGYYKKKLPAGTTALLKLEEFVAKFMGMYRKSIGSRQFRLLKE
ncbi:unnamed protein product [Linum trigynum]|uniref:Uncharacterized protein n=1 Tax=Linum trigynum TaxID=586398 RepID=A0AAV2F9M9_9ROSI